MPSDNPYAAPQTLEPRAPGPFLEPSDLSARRRLAEWDTARLKQLWHASGMIKEMRGAWLIVCFVMSVIAFFSFYFDTTRAILALCLVALTFTRFGMSYARSSFSRLFAIAMDGLLAFVCTLITVAFLWALLWAIIGERRAALMLVFFDLFIVLMSYAAVRSVRALWRATELFGPQRLSHQELEAEIKYREQHPSA